MEKNNSLFSISVVLNILFLAVGIYFFTTNIGDKDRISKLERAIENQRIIATGFEYTNRELRQNINQLYGINSFFEKTIADIRRTEQGFESANFEFGRGLIELRRINEELGKGNSNSQKRIEKIDKVLDVLENNGVHSSGSGDL